MLIKYVEEAGETLYIQQEWTLLLEVSTFLQKQSFTCTLPIINYLPYIKKNQNWIDHDVCGCFVFAKAQILLLLLHEQHCVCVRLRWCARVRACTRVYACVLNTMSYLYYSALNTHSTRLLWRYCCPRPYRLDDSKRWKFFWSLCRILR